MNRASYQHIPNIVLGTKKPKKTPPKKLIKGATFSPSTLSSVEPVVRERKPLLKLKF